MGKCLYCYRQLDNGEKDFHAKCAKKFFGTEKVPVLDYTCEDLERLAIQAIKVQTSLTGVQPKLSLHLNEHDGSQRLTIVGLWGGFICKPQTLQFELMPETEDLTMHLAELARIDVVPHTLMRMADNVLGAGVVDWHADVLQVHFGVAQPWLQSRKLVELLFGDTGKEAWNDARKYIADSMRAERHMP